MAEVVGASVKKKDKGRKNFGLWDMEGFLTGVKEKFLQRLGEIRAKQRFARTVEASVVAEFQSAMDAVEEWLKEEILARKESSCEEQLTALQKSVATLVKAVDKMGGGGIERRGGREEREKRRGKENVRG